MSERGLAPEIHSVFDRYARDIERLQAMLKECADDLESEIEGRYHGVKDHPAMTPKYERDMETVKRARALIAETT